MVSLNLAGRNLRVVYPVNGVRGWAARQCTEVMRGLRADQWHVIDWPQIWKMVSDGLEDFRGEFKVVIGDVVIHLE